MKKIRIHNLMNSAWLCAAFALLAVMLTSVGLSPVMAQDSEDWAVGQVQRAVRQQISARESVDGSTVLFHSDAQTQARTNTATRVNGTGTIWRNSDESNNNGRNNNGRNNNGRNNNGESREFSYEATVSTRNRNRNNNNNSNVSGIRYAWRGGWSNNGRDNDGRVGNYGNQSIYCASDDGRRHTCPIDTNGATVRLTNQRSGSNCVQGRTWGFNQAGIWVDRGCRADFEVSGGRDNSSYGRGNGGNGNAGRPNGRVSYSGPIMNRRSDKALDVTEQGMQDGADIQQWSYADQPNQNWDVIDLGNNEVAIISRHSGRAITVQGGRDNNGANIIQRGWNNTPQQRWRLEQTGGDYYRIVSVDNGKCLDVTEQGKENGAGIQLWDYANQANQQWRFKR